MEETGKRELEKLVVQHTRENTKVRACYLGIGLGSWSEELYEAVEALGMSRATALMAEGALGVYKEKVGEAYLLLQKTVAYEIQYHVEAYFYAIGKKEYFWKRHITTWAFPKKMLERRCEVIDIYYNGKQYPIWTSNFWEALLFGYPKK